MVDAVVAGSELGLTLCEELARLAPFGLGNPGVTLLIDGCELTELSTVGDGKHLRFRVRHRGRDAGSAIAFGSGAQLDRFRQIGRYDVAFRLQENRWNGTVSPQLVVRRIFDAPERYEELRTWLAEQWRAGEAGWTPEARAIFAELELAGGARRSLLESAAFQPPLKLDRDDIAKQAVPADGAELLVNVHFTVVNDFDSGFAGNAWANDSIDRQLQIWQLDDGTFCARVSDHGKFVTFAGASPSGASTVAAGIKAVSSRAATSLRSSPGRLPRRCRRTATSAPSTWRAPTPTTARVHPTVRACSTPSYFSSTSGAGLAQWGWIYRAGKHGTWLNQDDVAAADSGDIT